MPKHVVSIAEYTVCSEQVVFLNCQYLMTANMVNMRAKALQIVLLWVCTVACSILLWTAVRCPSVFTCRIMLGTRWSWSAFKIMRVLKDRTQQKGVKTDVRNCAAGRGERKAGLERIWEETILVCWRCSCHIWLEGARKSTNDDQSGWPVSRLRFERASCMIRGRYRERSLVRVRLACINTCYYR